MGLLLLLAGAGSATADSDKIVLRDNLQWDYLTPQIGYIIDPTGARTIDDIAGMPESAFTSPHLNSLNLGINPGAVWLRLDLDNQTKRNIWVVELNNARLEDVRSFVPIDGAWESAAIGTDYPVADRLAMHVLPALRLRLPEYGEAVCYLRVKHSGAMRFQVQLSTMERFRQQVTNRTAATFLIAGGLLSMVIFNLIVFATLREIAYLLLAATIFAFLAYSMALNGSGYIWVWPDAHWWSGRSATTTAMLHHAVLSLFFMQFMKPAPLPFVRRLGAVLFFLFLGLAGVALTDWSGKYYVVGISAALGPFLLQVGAIYAWWRGYRPAGQFAIAWGIAVLGLLHLSAINAGWLDHSYLRETMVSIAYVLAVVFFNLSLAERLRASEKLARSRLEEQVRSRTSELRNALKTVDTLSGLLPICSSCHKIRNDKGYWQSVEHYLHEHTDAKLSHGMCPDCLESVYPGYTERMTEFERSEAGE